MKTKIFLMLVLLCVINTTQADILSHWTLDETSGTMVADSVGSNTGTVMNETAADLTAAGVSNTGFDSTGEQFNGGYIEASSIFTGNAARAISLWFNADNIEGQARLVGMGSGAAGSFDILVEQYDEINSISLRYGNGNMAWSGTAEFGSAIQTDTWYHVVVQYDGTTLVADSGLEVYVNATKLARDGGNNNNSGQVLNTGGDKFLIAIGDLLRFPLDGTIDDVQVYDVPLSEDDIAFLYANPGVPTIGDRASVVAPTNNGQNINPDDDLEWSAPIIGTPVSYDVYFRANDPNFNYAGNIVDGVSVTAPTTTYPLGKLDFSTTYYWRVDVVTATETIEGNVWSFTTIPEIPVILTDPQAQTVEAGTTVVLAVEELNGTSRQWYKDGIAVTGNATAITSELTITNIQIADEGIYYCDVTNTADTVSSATAGVWTKRQIGQWDFEGTVDETSGDFTGVIVDPNTANAVAPDITYVEGVTTGTQALQFVTGQDNGYVEVVGSEDVFNFYPLGYTVNTWIKTTQGGYGASVSKQQKGTGLTTIGIVMNHNSASAISTIRQVGEDLSSNLIPVNDGQWHMVTGMYDGETGDISLYVDGVLRDQATTTATADVNGEPLIFGAETTAAAVPFEGTLDTVSIWTYAITPLEVAQMYADTTDTTVCMGDVEFDFTGPVGEPDCIVDILDFAEFAKRWLDSNLVYPQ